MYKIAKDIDIEYLNENNVIVDLNSGKFFGVNEISAIIIESISESKTESEIVEIICKKFFVDNCSEIKKDVSEFINLLEKNGIVIKVEVNE